MTLKPACWSEETRSLLLHGELNVPAGYAQRLGEPGQYFVRNERTGLYYSKYGLANAPCSRSRRCGCSRQPEAT